MQATTAQREFVTTMSDLESPMRPQPQAGEPARPVQKAETRMVALIVPDTTNPFFTEMAQGLDEVVHEAGFGLLICNSAGDAAREQAYIDLMTRSGTQALAIVPTGSSVPALRLLHERAIAVVLIDRDIPGASADSIFCDNESGAFQAVNHLLALGHRRIACISGPPLLHPSDSRIAGYLAALRSAAIPADPALLVTGDFQPSSGSAAARTLLELSVPPTAIFSCNDLMAIGVLMTARTMGLLLPQDLSVVGFDDILMASLAEPGLTTIEQPKLEYGRLAGKMLLERLQNPALPFRRAMLPTRLCMRSSTAPLA
jgi:LacI family transcriptional regulator